MSSGVVELDLIEELKLRRWARENYAPPSSRSSDWHPVVHEQVGEREHEQVETDALTA